MPGITTAAAVVPRAAALSRAACGLLRSLPRIVFTGGLLSARMLAGAAPAAAGRSIVVEFQHAARCPAQVSVERSLTAPERIGECQWRVIVGVDERTMLRLRVGGPSGRELWVSAARERVRVTLATQDEPANGHDHAPGGHDHPVPDALHAEDDHPAPRFQGAYHWVDSLSRPFTELGHVHGARDPEPDPAEIHPPAPGHNHSGRVGFSVAPSFLQSPFTRNGSALGRFTTDDREFGQFAARFRTDLMSDMLSLTAVYRPSARSTRATYDAPRHPSATAAPSRRDLLARRSVTEAGIGLVLRPFDRHTLHVDYGRTTGRRRGALFSPGTRIRPTEDEGLGLSGGNPSPDAAVRGSANDEATKVSFGYRYADGRWTFEIEQARSRAERSEHPEPGADKVLYADLRRDQVHVTQTLNDYEPIVPLEQVRLGGFGIFTASAAHESRLTRIGGSAAFQAGRARHQLGWEFATEALRLREQRLRSGPRGDAGIEVNLADNILGPIQGSYARVTGGVAGAIVCRGGVYPSGTTFADACPVAQYLLMRGELSPPAAALRVSARRGLLSDRWEWGRHTLTLAAGGVRLAVSDPTDFTLLGSRTGEPLLGANSLPVGTYDPDVPFGEAPRLLAGEGRFVGGSHRFPVEPEWILGWEARLTPRLRVGAAWARRAVMPDEHLLEHLFETRVSIVQGFFSSPDQAHSAGHTFIEGGAASRVATGTRLAARDEFRAVFDGRSPAGFEFSASLFHRRQRRGLAQVQHNRLENILNYYLDPALYADAVGGSNLCVNCPPEQLHAFAYATPGTLDDGTPNPEARGSLALTLANPGENTPGGLFPRATRRSTGVLFTAKRPRRPESRMSVDFALQLARTRGNDEGLGFAGDDQQHAEPRSGFLHPASPLTAGYYRSGPLPDEFPTFAAVRLAWRDLLLPGLSVSTVVGVKEGALRTSRLAVPLSRESGDLPGDQPDYFRFDMNLDGDVDRVVLRGYRPVARGNLGREPHRWQNDLGISYGRTLRGNRAWRLSVDVRNVLNLRRTDRHDDRVEIPLDLRMSPPGHFADQPAHLPTRVDWTTRIANPDFGRALEQSEPRTVLLGFEFRF